MPQQTVAIKALIHAISSAMINTKINATINAMINVIITATQIKPFNLCATPMIVLCLPGKSITPLFPSLIMS